MNNDNPKCSNPRHCDQPAMLIMNLSDAKTEYRYIVAFLAGGWGLFVAILFWNFNPIFFLVYAAVGLFVTAKLIPHIKDVMRIATELELEGITVQGVIVDRRVEPEGEGGCYYVGYHFSYMDSMWVGKQRAASPPFNKLQIGDSVAIRFLPCNPRISLVAM